MDESQTKSKSLTILQKLRIIKMVENGRSVKEVAEEMGINRNTLHYILKNRDKISEASKKPGLSYHKRIKQTKNPELESIVLNYIYKAKANNERLTGSIIKSVALETSLNMNCTNFAASNGWLFSFLKRNDIAMSDLNKSVDINSSKSLKQYDLNTEDDTAAAMTVVYEEIHGVDSNPKSPENTMEMKLTTEHDEQVEEEEIEKGEERRMIVENEDHNQMTQIDWRGWCRLCGNTESMYSLHSQIFDILKHLIDFIDPSKEVKVCEKCNKSIDEFSKFIQKGREVENMFNELEEREKINCLTDEDVNTIRHEYGIEEGVSSKSLNIEEISNISFERDIHNGNQQELMIIEDDDNLIYEVDYLEEAEEELAEEKEIYFDQEIQNVQQQNSNEHEMDDQNGEQQLNYDQGEEYEIVEQTTIDSIEEAEGEEIEEGDEEIITEEYSTVENENLNTKLMREEELYTYTCHICSENFERMCFLTNHTRNQHDCLPQVACTCGKLLSTWESLMNHKRKHTSGIGEWSCGHCGARFVTKTGLSIHIKFKHEKQRKKYICKSCRKEFKDIQTLKSHERTHLLSNDQKFQVECEFCQKKLSNKYSLRHHIATVHERQKTILCHLCSKGFSNRSNLKSHLISHSTDPVKCEICSNTFKNRVSLQSHKKIHKPKELLNFSCSECDKKFHNRNHLERHMISHSDVRNFKCTVENCNMSYKWEKDLKNHLAIHNGEKENKCMWCDSSFVDIGNLRKHKLKYHPQELEEFESKYGKGRKLKMYK